MDGKCGTQYRLSDGTPTQCDPDGENPCCNNVKGVCGNTPDDCDCLYGRCVNYTRLYKEWRGGNQTWRYDGRLGEDFPLPDGSPSECNPDSDLHCADKNNKEYCTNGTIESEYRHINCFCPDCLDYRIVRKVRRTGKKCVVVPVSSRFLGNVCIEERNQMMRQYFKCTHSDIYYHNVAVTETVTLSVSRQCRNDPHVYQVCVGISIEEFRKNTQITNRDVLCGGYFCDSRKYDLVSKNADSGTYAHAYIKCTGEDCKPENRNCREPSDREGKLCNDVCDEGFCGDESNCRGYRYAFRCLWKPLFELAAAYQIGYKLCDDTCRKVSELKACATANANTIDCVSAMMKVHFKRLVTVPVLNYTRCAVLPLDKVPFCVNYLDQTNCSEIYRVGGYCKINGYISSVSKDMVCYTFNEQLNTEIKLCDDNLQNTCVSPLPTCTIHKHRLCDRIRDCPDASDEVSDVCESTTKRFNFHCKRSFNPVGGDFPIPVSWLLDNDTDCINGEDENKNAWQLCAGEFKMIARPGEHCQNVFKCPGNGRTYVSFEQLCDGVESCGNGERSENEVCKIAREFPAIKKTASYNGTIRDLCITGTGTCEMMEFKRKWGYVFGEPKIELYAPVSKVKCNSLFGEYYLFLSCMDLCLEPDIECLLADEKRRLEHNSCPGKSYQNRYYSVVNNSALTFVIDSNSGGHYNQDIFKCDNGRCVGYPKVCDLIDDCGDMSDEIYCKNHMICKNTLNSTKQQFISLSQRCDGIYDCFDLSDECNSECGKEILGNPVIKIMCWVIGLLATLFNFLSVVHGFSSLKDCNTEELITTKVLMNLIGVGDFLVGLYLSFLSVYDSLLIGKHYCKHQVEWLTGRACSFLGVISTLGSQISLFTMTVLSVIRMYGLICKPMQIPEPLTKNGVLRIIFLVIATVGPALFIALTPLAPSLQDYFVQGMYYNSSYKVFIGFKNKERLIKILRAYYQTDMTENANSSIKESWNDIATKVRGMFSQDYGNLTGNPVHFYGNDGVCLFKYFVRTDDAKRSRQPKNTSADLLSFKGDPKIVWTMLAVNFSCFILITICYVVIIYHTKKSTYRSGQRDNPGRQAEEEAIQKRIMIIIGTDFLSWVPFIVICALHNLEYIDASFWYASFTVTVMPLNSVINPLLYDKALAETIRRHLSKLKLKGKITRKINNTFVSNVDGQEEEIPDEIPMNRLGSKIDLDDKNKGVNEPSKTTL